MGDETDRTSTSRGITLFADMDFTTGSIDHQLTAGVSLKRNTLRYNDNESANPGDIDNNGLFITDRITLGDQWELIPGLSYETYSAETAVGADNNSIGILPKLTVGYHPFSTGALSGMKLYGSVARGMRAPSLTQLSLTETSSRTRRGVTTTTTTLANPDLEAEFSLNREIGLRYSGNNVFNQGDNMSVDLAIYKNDFTDKIEDVTVSSTTDGSGNTTTVNQLQNIGEANYEGVELAVRYDGGNFYGGLAAEYSEGTNEETGLDLNSVRPPNATVYFGTRLLERKLDVGFEVEGWGSKDEVGENDGVVGDSTEGTELVNLYASYQLTKYAKLDFRIDNVADQLYRRFDTIDNGMRRNVKLNLTVNY